MSANESTSDYANNHDLTDDSFALYALMAKQTQEAERVATAFQQQRQALLRDHADNELVQMAVWALQESEADAKRLTNRLKRNLHRYCPGPNVLAFVDDTMGLGPACHLFLGLLPQWVAEFATVSKLWAYCGLHVVDGAAPRRKKGVRANWSAELKAIAIKRLAEPCMKKQESPYRAVYDARKAHCAVTHPDWPDWHRHKDALRITAKQIVKDLWRVSRGHEPLFGGVDPRASDTPLAPEDPTDSTPVVGGDLSQPDTPRVAEAPDPTVTQSGDGNLGRSAQPIGTRSRRRSASPENEAWT